MAWRELGHRLESDFAAFLLQLAREGGSAAGGALAVLLFVLYLLLSDHLITRGRYLDKERQLNAALRELRKTTRALQAAPSVAERVVNKLPKRGN